MHCGKHRDPRGHQSRNLFDARLSGAVDLGQVVDANDFRIACEHRLDIESLPLRALAGGSQYLDVSQRSFWVAMYAIRGDEHVRPTTAPSPRFVEHRGGRPHPPRVPKV